MTALEQVPDEPKGTTSPVGQAIFELASQIRVEGTTRIRTLDVIRQIGTGDPEYAAHFEPGKQTVRMEWTDRDARPGETHMYYVRIQQENAALAWASPMWIRYR